MRPIAVAAALFLVAGPVFAQTQPTPATPEQIATARAHADRLIAEAGAGAWFENVTDSALTQVRHTPSGMRCTFPGGVDDRIIIFPTGSMGIPQGDDVGCRWRAETLSILTTLYATRYRPMPSEEAVLRDAVNAIQTTYPSATPYRGEVVSMETEDRGVPLSAAFNIETDSGPRFTMALVWHSDEWSYKARATGPQNDAFEISLYMGITFTGSLLEIDD